MSDSPRSLKEGGVLSFLDGLKSFTDGPVDPEQLKAAAARCAEEMPLPDEVTEGLTTAAALAEAARKAVEEAQAAGRRATQTDRDRGETPRGSIAKEHNADVQNNF